MFCIWGYFIWYINDFKEGPDSTLFNEFRDYCKRIEIEEDTLNYFNTKYVKFAKINDILEKINEESDKFLEPNDKIKEMLLNV